jgi:hypothetical protein
MAQLTTDDRQVTFPFCDTDLVKPSPTIAVTTKAAELKVAGAISLRGEPDL